MTVSDKVPRNAVSHEKPLANFGKSAILATLILSGAVIVSISILWQNHVEKVRLAEMCQIEESVRTNMRTAYHELRAGRPESTLRTIRDVLAQLDALKAFLPAEYAELEVPALLLEGEALLMLDCRANAAIAEQRFDQALTLMEHASGEIWQMGMLGRGRSHYEAGRYAEALADFDALAKSNPSFGAVFYWRALARGKTGDAAGAADDEKRARALASWPPLRDFMQDPCSTPRDFLQSLGKNE